MHGPKAAIGDGIITETGRPAFPVTAGFLPDF